MSANPEIQNGLIRLCDTLDEARRLIRELAQPELADAELCLNLTVDQVRRARMALLMSPPDALKRKL